MDQDIFAADTERLDYKSSARTKGMAVVMFVAGLVTLVSAGTWVLADDGVYMYGGYWTIGFLVITVILLVLAGSSEADDQRRARRIRFIGTEKF